MSYIRPKNLNLEWLIFGWAKGGTHFIAETLVKSGYPCVHECFQIDAEGLFYCKKEDETVKADCSYITGEWKDYERVKDVPMIRLVRDPLCVIQSRTRRELNDGKNVDWDF